MADSFESLAERLIRIGAALRATAAFWRPAPFHHPILPWAAEAPELHAALLALPGEQVEALHDDPPRLRRWLAPYLPGLAALEPLLSFKRFQAPPISPLLARVARDVPGRKWAQVAAFAAVARDVASSAGCILDWCSGKAHLGRLLGLDTGLPVQAFERDAYLCQEARRLAERDGVQLTAEVCDVLHDPLALPPDALACALHACGDLHLALLDQVAATRLTGLVLAPCCYHRTRQAVYTPRSRPGRACELHLARDDLRLAVLETATAGRAQREAEQRRKARLLALKDWGAQHGLAVTDYLCLKNLAQEADVPALQNACERLGWPIPRPGQVERAMRTGWKRFSEVRAFELIRTAMRRPLEVWLVLDLALGLAENHLIVEVGEFCDSQLTPRNLLIVAKFEQGT